MNSLKWLLIIERKTYYINCFLNQHKRQYAENPFLSLLNVSTLYIDLEGERF